MARKPRIEFPGAFYHVITRGNQKQEVFRSPEDRQKYLQVLATYKEWGKLWGQFFIIDKTGALRY